MLYTLLREANITHLSLPWVMNLTSVIAKLRQAGVVIECQDKPHINKFGRKITYGVWSIPATEFYNAWKIYGIARFRFVRLQLEKQASSVEKRR